MNTIIIIFICIIVADFITGIVHWWEDTYGLPHWGWGIGKHIVEPNLVHHEHPTWLATMSNIIQRNYIQVVPAVVVSCIILYSLGISWWPVALTFILSSLGNEVHAWNHMPQTEQPTWMRFLSDTAIIQTRRQHSLHHKKPYDKYYCTLTNITNAVLELINFWRRLEWILLKVFGLTVKRCKEERRGY